MNIVGISAYYHDSAASLVIDGKIIAAAQQERFSRKKHDSEFPGAAIDYCIRAGGLTPAQVDHFVFYDKPFLKFERLLETYLAFAPRGLKSFVTSMPVWIKDKLFQKRVILDDLVASLGGQRNDYADRLLFSEHHLSHAASAFYPSPFESAAVLTMDGVGEWSTTSLAMGNGQNLVVTKEIHFPHSLGLLYSAFTYYTGFKVNSGEYKVMGLAPYGEPKYTSLIKEHLIEIADDGSFHLNMDYFDYCTALRMTNEKFHALFGAPPRKPESELTQREMDLAASIQAVTEEIVLKLASGIQKETRARNLCLAGGVALNCVANGKLLRSGIFENIYVQPAAGDAGGALGAALGAYHLMLKQPRQALSGAYDQMKGSYLGPEFSDHEIASELDTAGAVYEIHEYDELIDRVARLLAEGHAFGWVQGRMEFGPRALGGRSIIADPRSPKMQRNLNLKVKFRESFRPFAPSVLLEDANEWFDLDVPSPYMLMVADVQPKHRLPVAPTDKELFGIEKLNVPKSSIPAVTHVDYSARIQTVTEETNPLYYRLIKQFKTLTGCPVLVNTSFNVRGEPIVSSPSDAFRCFMGCNLDYLVVGKFLLKKTAQDPSKIVDYTKAYELD